MIDQLITEDYAIYNGDCMEMLRGLDDESIDLSIYSPPFAGLYNYSSSHLDLSNCSSKEEFLEHYGYVIEEMSRVTRPGRISAVHCADIFDNSSRLWDLPHHIIDMHEKAGFEYRNRITIWKEPLKVRMRTMVQSLMHKFIVEDSTRCFTAMPDYVLIFTKMGENETPVVHPKGFSEYFGQTPILPNMLKAWNNKNGSSLNEEQLWNHLNNTYNDWGDPKTNKLSHYIWQRYASSVWDDIRIDNVLPFRESRDEEDEKHVHPLQLDVIDRLVVMYSNPGEVCATPFMGVGSEVYSPVSMGRKAVGAELKPSYYRQSVNNLRAASSRFEGKNQGTLF